MQSLVLSAVLPGEAPCGPALDVTLSVIIPAYNEASTIEAVLDRVCDAGISSQVVVVDDGSGDGTGAVAARWIERTGRPVQLIAHPRNLGKGAAIRSALGLVTGSHVVIQDADLECDPADLVRLLAALDPRWAPVVYGSRYLGGAPTSNPAWNRWGVRLLNGVLWCFYGRTITDSAACYKMIPTAVLRSLDLRCRRFEFCPEVTSKLCRLGWRIAEVPVGYRPRSHAEGKKLRASDGLIALWSLLRWRFAPLPRAALRANPVGRGTGTSC